MTPTLAEAIKLAGGAVALLGALWAATRWLFAPHVRQTVEAVIDSKIDTKTLTSLTGAVERLTDAFNRQSTDSEHLAARLDALGAKVDALSETVAHVAERTATLEGTLAAPRPSKRIRGVR